MEIKPLTKRDYVRGELAGFVRPPDIAPDARLGVKWLALLRFSDGTEGYFMVESDRQARALWPDFEIMRQELIKCQSGINQMQLKIDQKQSKRGAYSGRARTLEDIGLELGVTRQRVKQIETQALAKFRANLLRLQAKGNAI